MLSLSTHEGRRDSLTATLVMTGALLAVAHGAIFVRLADAEPLLVAAIRLVIATAVLLPVALWREGAALRALDRRQAALVALAGLFLALHFATWITSVGLTSIANSVLLVNLSPVWIALWASATGRRPGWRLWSAIALAVCGTLVITHGDSAAEGTTSLTGDLLAIAGGVAMAAYLLTARRARQSLPLAAYVALAYGAAAVLLVAAAAATGADPAALAWPQWQALVALALVSQVLGHTGYNWALGRVEASLVALVLLGEPVFAAALGWLWFGEALGWPTAAGGALVLAAIWLGARAGQKA
ncbi:MAG: DMT family transporter [Alphaproteobacteria bacterium]